MEGLDPVRKRPGMYIGSTGPAGLHHLLYETFDNSYDEALAGYAKNIEVVLLPDSRVRVKDDGRGIPVEKHKQTGKSALETVMTTLHAGGKFGGDSYKISGGLHGVGVSVVNALSVYLKAEVCRDGLVYQQEYERGKPKSAVKKVGKGKQTGTTVTFEPDSVVFGETNFDWQTVVAHLRQQAYLIKGIRISLRDERQPVQTISKTDKELVTIPTHTFYFEGGVISYIKYFLNRHEESKHPNIFYVLKDLDKIQVEVGFQYTADLQGKEMGFANNIHTIEGGMHVTGFRSAITRALNDFARQNGYLKEKDENLTGDDVREGLTAVVSVKLREPQFEGQTKAKLGNPEARTAVESVLNAEIPDWLERNPTDARAIMEKVMLASKARIAAKAARETVIRKGALEGFTLPGKLADCSSKNPAESELFIVEGESAGGCFSGDTKVALLDGRNLSFKKLTEEDKQGKKNYCYTIDKNGNIAVASVLHPRITKKEARVVKILLDNGEEIVCTPGHKFMLRNGKYKEAQCLATGDSLMPLYRKSSEIGGRITIRGYEMVLDPVKHFWFFTHLLSDEYNLKSGVYKISDGQQRHHKDFNKLNNNPSNLVRLSKEGHLKIHQEIANTVLRSPAVLEKLRKIRQTLEFRNKIRKSMLEIRGLLSARAKKQWENEEYKKFMISKFLEFYHSSPEYRKRNNKLLNKLQKQYWKNPENRKAQSLRTRFYYEKHPEDIKRRSVESKKQWQDQMLRDWRREKTKEQWTPEFRLKRKKAYNKTYFDNSLKLMRQIWERSGSIDNYDKERIADKNKNALSLKTLTSRFFDGDSEKIFKVVQNYNHKVVRVERLNKKIDVYDIEVPETHNFALASGVFVHNSSKQGRDRRTQAILPLKGKILNVEKSRIDKMLASQEIRALIIALGTAIAEEFDLSKLRYHKIIIMADSDVDGAHIRTLLLTLFYRYFPQLIASGHVYIAQPPLYKIQAGREIRYAYNDRAKEKILEELSRRSKTKEDGKKQNQNQKIKEWEITAVGESKTDETAADQPTIEEPQTLKGVSIQRYKGLGEMNPAELWETTMDRDKRILLRVTVKEAEKADEVFDTLMGSEVLPRKKFIQTHAKRVKNLDI